MQKNLKGWEKKMLSVLMPSEMVICYEINLKVNRDTHKLHVKSAEPQKFFKK